MEPDDDDNTHLLLDHKQAKEKKAAVRDTGD